MSLVLDLERFDCGKFAANIVLITTQSHCSNRLNLRLSSLLSSLLNGDFSERPLLDRWATTTR